MATNGFSGVCYRCGIACRAGAGVAEPAPGYKRGTGGRLVQNWNVQHAECALAYRGFRFDIGACERPKDMADADRIHARLVLAQMRGAAA